MKQHSMGDADLHDFIACYNLENRHERKETWSEDKFWTYVGINYATLGICYNCKK